jgi:hypothetical protein
MRMKNIFVFAAVVMMIFRGGAHATTHRELAKLHFSQTSYGMPDDSWPWSSPDATFGLQMDEYTRVEWKYPLNLDAAGVYVALKSSSYDAFVTLLTDGIDLEVVSYLSHHHGGLGSEISSPPLRESELFQDQKGCTNGVDLEGNLIESVSYRMDYETLFDPYWNWTYHSYRNQTFQEYNFTVLFEGRPLQPYEGALAVVDFQGRGFGCGIDVWIIDLVLKHGSKWALQRHLFDFEGVSEYEATAPLTDEYGTHSMHELLTDGMDDVFKMDIDAGCHGSTGTRESAMFRYAPACYNGIDLEGSYVEEVSLIFRGIESDFPGHHRVHPRVVFWGNLGEAPTPTPTPTPTLAPTLPSSDGAAHIRPSLGLLVAMLLALYRLLS